MDIKDLQYFLCVAEELHFGNAAKRLALSQPALSVRIRELERELGVTLFLRTRRSVALTKAGEHLRARSQRIIWEFHDIVDDMSRFRSQDVESIHIAIPADTPNTPIGLMATGLFERFPHLDLRITEAATQQQLRMLDDGRLDIGVVRHPYPRDGLASDQALSTPLGVMVSTDHRLATRSTITVADLRDEQLLMFPRRVAIDHYDHLTSQLRVAGFQGQPINRTLRLLNILVAQGQGFTLGHADSTDPSLPIHWIPLEPKLWIATSVVRPLRSHPDPLHVEAVDLLTSLLHEHSCWKRDRPDATD